MGLVEGYESISVPLAEPKLRAGLEKDLQRICDGIRIPSEVLSEQIQIYKEVFQKILERSQTIDATLANRLQVQPVDAPEPPPGNQFHEVHKCPRCSSMMVLKTMPDNRIMLTCLGFPTCNHSMWFPQEYFREATLVDEECQNCGTGFKKIKFKLKGLHLASFLNANNVEGLSYVTCVACDRSLKELCGQGSNRPNNASTTLSNRNNNTTVAASTRPNNGYINPNARNYQSSHNSSTASGNQQNASRSSSNDTHYGGGSSESDANNRPSRPSRPSNRDGTSRNDDTDVKCPTCGKVLNALTVRKNTANIGRQFYSCCSFFKWADEMAAPSTSTGILLIQFCGVSN